jgi:hypothetical protein
MSSVAVQLIEADGNVISGVLTSDPKVGQNLRITTGNDGWFSVPKVRGWLGLCNSNKMIIFDCFGNRLHMSLLAKSSDFLL